MKFICPNCEAKENFVEMSLDEDAQKHVCPECQHEVSLDEAKELFESGEIVGIVDESEIDEKVEKSDEITIAEDIEAFKNVCEGENLSEEAVAKSIAIFESAVVTKAKELAEQIAEERAKEYEKNLFETVNEYLDYVVSEWVEENRVALERGIKAKMDEELSEGIAELLKNHYFKAPEDRWDIVEGLAERIEELEAKLDEQVEKTIEAKRQLFEEQKKSVFSDVVEGLAETEKERVEKLAENIKANSIDEYRSALEAIAESFVKTTSSKEDVNEENSGDSGEKEINPIEIAARMLSAKR